MTSPDKSTIGTQVTPLVVNGNGDSYTVYPTNNTVLVQQINYQITCPASTIDEVVWYNSTIYIRQKNGDWYKYNPANASGGSFTFQTGGDPRP
jgi:hypothetical protein